jgi:hypothetical protein
MLYAFARVTPTWLRLHRAGFHACAALAGVLNLFPLRRGKIEMGVILRGVSNLIQGGESTLLHLAFIGCAGSIPIVKIFYNYNIFLIHAALPRVVYRLLRGCCESLPKP